MTMNRDRNLLQDGCSLYMTEYPDGHPPSAPNLPEYVDAPCDSTPAVTHLRLAVTSFLCETLKELLTNSVFFSTSIIYDNGASSVFDSR